MSFAVPNKKRPTKMAIDSPRTTKRSKTKNASKEFDEKYNYFNDDCSQYFSTQFDRQINSAESNQNKVINSTIKNQELAEIADNDEDLNESIPLGQRTLHQNDHDQNDLDDFGSQVDDDKDKFNTAISIDFDENDGLEITADADVFNSSQLFLNEVSTIQMNINSIIDDALKDDRFTLIQNDVTSSQYIQLTRVSEEAEPQKTVAVEDKEVENVANADIEAFSKTNAFDSLLAAGFEDFEDDNNELNDQKPIINNQNSITNKAHPVTASKFYNLGPFYGLPNKVLKLIQQLKGIDDLYGKRRRFIDRENFHFNQ